jgi:hypothetical protein
MVATKSTMETLGVGTLMASPLSLCCNLIGSPAAPHDLCCSIELLVRSKAILFFRLIQRLWSNLGTSSWVSSSG